jgi:hypothetical protein
MAWMQGLSVLLGGPGAAVWKAPRRGNRQGDNLGWKSKEVCVANGVFWEYLDVHT